SSTTKRALDSKDSPYVVEVIFTTPTAVDIEHMRKNEDVKHFEYAFKIETVFQLGGAFRRHKRLAVFDMDSTLIQQEVIDEIAAKIGVQSEVAAITERAMNGELDFEGSLRQRCGLLAGVSSNVWEELKSVITLSPGAQDLVRALKRLGYKTAVLSGGFTPLATWLAGELGLDYVHANHLVVSEDGQTLTGELTGDIVHAERKRDLVREIAAKEGITLSQVLTVGDGANDLPMLGIAGLGVAFNAKPRVQELAPTRLNTSSLFDVLYLLGFSRVERQELLSS
ncbi:phosphoserine phosphatase serb, partial [Trichodelitschia bisporula]